MLGNAAWLGSRAVPRLDTIIVETPNNQVVDMESADGDSDRSEGSESVSEIAGVAETMADFNTREGPLSSW